MNPKVNASQKPTIDSQKLKREEHNHTSRSTREETERINKQRRTTKTTGK